MNKVLNYIRRGLATGALALALTGCNTINENMEHNPESRRKSRELSALMTLELEETRKYEKGLDGLSFQPENSRYIVDINSNKKSHYIAIGELDKKGNRIFFYDGKNGPLDGIIDYVDEQTLVKKTKDSEEWRIKPGLVNKWNQRKYEDALDKVLSGMKLKLKL